MESARHHGRAGVHVVYGVVGLKTHTKVTLVVRDEGQQGVRTYCHIGTGTYNGKAARIYEDQASGKKDDRPGLEACLKSLRETDTLIVWKLDRLGRAGQQGSFPARNPPPARSTSVRNTESSWVAASTKGSPQVKFTRGPSAPRSRALGPLDEGSAGAR